MRIEMAELKIGDVWSLMATPEEWDRAKSAKIKGLVCSILILRDKNRYRGEVIQLLPRPMLKLKITGVRYMQ